MQLPQLKTTVYCAKWCKVGFVTCIDGDPTTLFVVFTNDLPSSVPFGSVYMYADDTTIYCVGETADLAIDQVNKALREFYNWCLS